MMGSTAQSTVMGTWGQTFSLARSVVLPTRQGSSVIRTQGVDGLDMSIDVYLLPGLGK